MSRHAVTEAIVLHTHRIGEIHKGVTLLTRDMGIVSAIAHGALKTRSRLRSMTETFCCSRVYLYHDPVKGGYKITDMTALVFFENLRKRLSHYYTACLWAEVILRSLAAGESDSRIYDLFLQSLTLLKGADEPSGNVPKKVEDASLLNVQFLWRFLGHSGHRPEIDVCAACGRHLEPDESAYMDDEAGGLVCGGCVRNGRLSMTPGSRRYLLHSSTLPLGQAARLGLDRESLAALKQLLFELVQSVLEVPLNSLAYVKGLA